MTVCSGATDACRRPIALCEVQGYAYEAAVHGADLLDAFALTGVPIACMAQRLAGRLPDTFWVSTDQRVVSRYRNIDVNKQP